MVAESGYSPPMPMPSTNRSTASTAAMEIGPTGKASALASVPRMTSDSVATNPFLRPICTRRTHRTRLSGTAVAGRRR